VAEKFIKCREMPKGRGRNLALKKAWSYKQRFADIDFGYCLTSHKAQGSTYDTVIVVEDDILSVNPITEIEKSQSMYVAISRASNKVYVVSNLNK
jgi:ATP-dependent exoDNAse (exonuclease V) alpha subunit